MKQLVITRKEKGENLILLLEDGILVEKHLENTNNKNIEGNIFVGKVQNVLPGLESAFVNIGKNRNAFIAVKDILPKKDKLKDSSEDNEHINKIIKPGEPLIVQVKKDSSVKKGVRVSTHLNIPGRFIALCPNTPFVTVSQKVTDKAQREKLKELVKKYLPSQYGAIVRTSAQNVSENEIAKDIKNLIDLWNNIRNQEIDEYPKQIYSSGGIIQKILIDTVDAGLEKVIVEDEKLKEIVQEIMIKLNKKIFIEVDEENILYNYNLDRQLKNVETRKIWLKNGGFITIDATEALIAIDVNSGKNIGKKDVEETIYNVNYEATIEIAKQLRLRDIGGIIIIDYIDMHIEENKDKIVELLKKESKKDRSKIQVEGFTKLNLVELTRKHLYSNS